MSFKRIILDIFVILDLREKRRLGKLILLDVVFSILDISFLALLLFVIHFYVEGGRGARLPFSALSVFDTHPLSLIGVFFVLFTIKNFAGYHVGRMQYQFIYRVATRLSGVSLMHYLEGSYREYSQVDSSVHIRTINQQPTEFCHYVLGGFQQITSQSILIVITVIATLIYNPLLFLLLFVILTPPLFLAGFLIKKRMSSLRETAKPVSERSLQHLNEALAGFIESNVYQRKTFFTTRYLRYQTKFNEFLANLQVVQGMPNKLIEVFAVFGFLILVLINSYTSGTGTVQLLMIGAFMGAAYKIIPGIVKILNSVGQIRTYGFTVKDLVALCASGNSEPPAISSNGQPVAAIGSIEFKKVSFHYGEAQVLGDFSMALRGGEMIGISGVSGRGKTTLVNLLLGFLDPVSGDILINGVATDIAGRRRYWRNISYVKQQPFLIFDSILRNIILDEEAYDPDRLREVVRATGLDKLNGRFPEGLQTMITENGRNISGGQRQRIAFARGLYKNADLLILDEPFSELDETAERELMGYCRQLAKSGKAILLISHNRTNFSFCDKTIFLDEE
jgi:ABC-type multidrug transport system fused ATPase/permease subunit